MRSLAGHIHIDPQRGDGFDIPASMDHASFRRWVLSDAFPERLHATYVQGEVLLDMSREELETHNKIKSELTFLLLQIAKKEKLGEYWSDGVLVTHEAAELSTEPDASFVLFGTYRSGRVRLMPKVDHDDHYVELQGSPDVVIEVVSDSSNKKDFRTLRAAYARAGIPEYWIIDARADAIRFLILHLDGDAYRESAGEAEPQPSRIFARRFQLTRTRNELDRYTYDLAIVP